MTPAKFPMIIQNKELYENSLNWQGLSTMTIGPKQWQNNQAPNKYKFHFYIRARIKLIRCQNQMELSDLTL